MRVAFLSGNAQSCNAVGNQIAERVRFFQERGAEVRLFVADARQLHPDLLSCANDTAEPMADYLRSADLIFAAYAQYHELLPYLAPLAGTGPRIVFDYFGVTPAGLWQREQREGLEHSARGRGYVWCADHALTTSQANRRELIDATHFPAEHITTLPLVVDTERFRSEPRDGYLQKKLGITGRILIYVGRLAGNKRVPLLIEALAKLNDPTIHVVIVGDCQDIYAEEAARCQALAQQLGVTERVHFLGQLDDTELPRAYRSAAVLVMPSLHEGFCVPVIEAMASGLPVIASRSEALPETVGDAGLTFAPNDADDLACQLRRVLYEIPMQKAVEGPRRIAIVSFRFGPDIVGGAETSLRTMATALQAAGHSVEIFTTCTKSESQWQNDLPAGTTTLDGLTVHRFPHDPHDHAAHGEVVRTILDADGNVSPEVQARYLVYSIHSSALIAALRQRQGVFDAIITGPYLFGLTADVAREFPGQTLIVPCFHDEPLARLPLWPMLYSPVGGLLYHSPEEQNYAHQNLGVNHPNAWQIGTCIPIQQATNIPLDFPRPYVVYCGRYSEQKNVPLLLEWARRYQVERPGQLNFVFLGRGEVKLPSEPWLHDLGRVDEATKRAVLAGAKALIQLSTHESLSLVALEAWAEGTPVIVHADCAVLAGQIARSQGGAAIDDYDSMAGVLDDLQANAQAWRDRGARGRAYVEKQYASASRYVGTLIEAIDQITIPLVQQMRERGLQRAEECSRVRWQHRFAEFIDNLLTQPGRACRDDLRIEPLRGECHGPAGVRTLLLPIRLVNEGTHAAVPDGPGQTSMCCEVRETSTDRVVIAREDTRLPGLLMPGQAQVAALPITLPGDAGSYRVIVWMERKGSVHAMENRAEVALNVVTANTVDAESCVSVFLDTVQATLPQARQLQQLPDGYVDVTEGRLAPVKRLVKRKLLHNFKHAYVDVLSRQQSQVNEHVVLMIQQLAECCAMLDHAVAGIHRQLDGLEEKMDDTLLTLRESLGRHPMNSCQSPPARSNWFGL